MLNFAKKKKKKNLFCVIARVCHLHVPINIRNRQTIYVYHRHPYLRLRFGQTRGSRQIRLLGFAEVFLFSFHCFDNVDYITYMYVIIPEFKDGSDQTKLNLDSESLG